MGSREISEELTGRQQYALFHKLWLAGGGTSGGEEAIMALLRDELTIQFDNTVRLVDQCGRVTPIRGMKNVEDANREFDLIQPYISYYQIFDRLREFISGMESISATEFKERAEALIAKVKADKHVANLLKGVYLPLILPKILQGDYGTILEQVFLPAVMRSYERQFPDREFFNGQKGGLVGQIRINEASRHRRIVEAMCASVQVILIFPLAFQGFNIPGAVAAIREFPEYCSVAGAYELATAHVAVPATMARDNHVPIYDCTGVIWENLSLYFKYHNRQLRFDFRYPTIGGFYSSSLVVSE